MFLFTNFLQYPWRTNEKANINTRSILVTSRAKTETLTFA